MDKYIQEEEIMKWSLSVVVVVMVGMVGMAVSSGVVFADSPKQSDLEMQALVDPPNLPQGITFSVGPDEAFIPQH